MNIVRKSGRIAKHYKIPMNFKIHIATPEERREYENKFADTWDWFMSLPKEKQLENIIDVVCKDVDIDTAIFVLLSEFEDIVIDHFIHNKEGCNE